MTKRERLLDELRPVAFGIAYRMLGRVSEAEDVVQEALLRVPLRPIEVNGGPGGLLLDVQQRLIGVWALDIVDGRITNINSIVNPDKLTHVGRVADHPPR